MTYTELIRFLTFAFIGLFNAVLDVLIWKWLIKNLENHRLLKDVINGLKLNIYSFAHVISFLITVSSSYLLNRTFTFGQEAGGGQSQFLKFIAVSIASWVITTLILNMLTSSKVSNNIVNVLMDFERRVELKLSIINTKWHLIAKILTIGISMFTNYLGYRFLVF